MTLIFQKIYQFCLDAIYINPQGPFSHRMSYIYMDEFYWEKNGSCGFI